MDGIEVIDSISKIYDRFEVPANLRTHMLRVAAVANIICDRWKGPEISKIDLVAACLVHDLGNIVKYDLESKIGKGLIGSEAKVNELRALRDRITKNYGSDEYHATEKMLEELGVSDGILYISRNSGRVFTDGNLPRVSWEVKIYVYSDSRVSPQRVMSLKDRYEEYRKRYAEKAKAGHKSWFYDHMNEALAILDKTEKEIFSNTSIKPEDINDKSVEPYLEKYRKSK